METIIEVPENNIRIGIEFSELNREEGFDDDIRISLSEPAPTERRRLFRGDEVSFLVTPAQAKKLGHALLDAAEESRNTPRE
ncbi:MAG: hypothetical protein FJ280_04345 [Planctomycetes bacterium]|nr:hypothetical protein [Planctomycetota bacterium]